MNDQDTFNKAKWILLMPDLIAYHLTGEVSTEITNASTTSLYSHKKQDWLGLKEEFYKISHKFPTLVKPGTLKGHLKASFGLKQLPIISICSHDTASAYISVKQKDSQALINSGTWSLVGKIIKQPIIKQTVLEYGFTNETGMFHHVRFLKNIMGFWIINQIKADLEKHQETYSFFKLEKKAISAEPFQYFIDPDDNIFLEPGHMIDKVNMYFEKTNQKQTHDIGVILRCVYESLAFKYRLTIERLELITKYHIDDIMIIGGGNQSDLLNQFTANLTNRKIIIGPTEATVLGNALVQMYYFRDVKTIKSGQNLIENSFEQIVYEPDYCNEYEKAYERFKSIIGNEGYHG
jgi:sugar (pentulose or hexulose) kinase